VFTWQGSVFEKLRKRGISNLRVLFFGSCPLPLERGVPAQGPGIRTWQLIKPVCDSGHQVAAILLRTQGVYHEPLEDVASSNPYPNLSVYNMKYERFTDISGITAIAEKFRPDAIVGAASVLPNFMAAKMAHLAPFWADCFGDPIAEIQAKAEMYGAEKCAHELFAVWKYFRKTLSTADQFSALSDAQNHALIGELALLGRLGFENAGTPLVFTIPCGVEPPEKTPAPQKPFLRGAKFPSDAFVICFSGSYNTWMDVDYLFEATEESMKRLPQLLFLSIGGGTPGYNEKLYKDFCSSVQKSPHKNRYIFCGWVPFEEVPKYYAESNLGINIDRFTYEGVLGSRNRIVQFLAHGLPVVSTPLSEISVRLSKRGLVHCFRMRSEKGCSVVTEPLPDLLCRLAKNPENLKQVGRLAKKIVSQEFNFKHTAAPLLDWLVSPERAPDNKIRMQKPDFGRGIYLNEIERLTDFDRVTADLDFLNQEKSRLDKIRQNPLFRIFKKIKNIFS